MKEQFYNVFETQADDPTTDVALFLSAQDVIKRYSFVRRWRRFIIEGSFSLDIVMDLGRIQIKPYNQ